MSSVLVRVDRPLMYLGERAEAGTHLRVSPADAAALVDGGRATLLDAAALPQLVEARSKELHAALREAARRPDPLPVDPRWQRQ